MGIRGKVDGSRLRLLADLVVLGLMSAACTTQPAKPPALKSSAQSSTSPIATSSLSPVPSRFLIARISPQAFYSYNQRTYRVDLIDTAGAVRLTTGLVSDPITRAGPTLGDGEWTINTLPFAFSRTRLYYMDADFVIHWLDKSGRKGVAIKLQLSGRKRVAFAVSPDDSRVAIGIMDYNRSYGSTSDTGYATNSVYVEKMDGTDRITLHRDVIKLWFGGDQGPPPGWGTTHDALLPALWLSSRRLVLGFTESAPYQNGDRNGPMFFSGFRVVDPATGITKVSVSNCHTEGPPMEVGVLCADWRFGSVARTSWVTWDGSRRALKPGPNELVGYLPSPDGLMTAGDYTLSPTSVGLVFFSFTTLSQTKTGQDGQPMAWIDPHHLVVQLDTSPVSYAVYDLTTRHLFPIKGSQGIFWSASAL